MTRAVDEAKRDIARQRDLAMMEIDVSQVDSVDLTLNASLNSYCMKPATATG